MDRRTESLKEAVKEAALVIEASYLEMDLAATVGRNSFSLNIAKKNCREWLDKYWGEQDPTPWCSACQAKTASQCDCGPIAEND